MTQFGGFCCWAVIVVFFAGLTGGWIVYATGRDRLRRASAAEHAQAMGELLPAKEHTA